MPLNQDKYLETRLNLEYINIILSIICFVSLTQRNVTILMVYYSFENGQSQEVCWYVLNVQKKEKHLCFTTQTQLLLYITASGRQNTKIDPFRV